MELSRALALCLAVAAILSWLHWALKCKAIWLYAIVPLTWLLNEAAFWFTRLFFVDALPITTINIWSMALHFHGLLLVLFVPVVFWRCPMTPRRRASDHDGT